LHAKKTAFVIEHDFIMATYLADRVIVFEGQPAVAATATPYATALSVLLHISDKCLSVLNLC
jgi:ATP-binding cassette, sub-family E, member 1